MNMLFHHDEYILAYFIFNKDILLFSIGFIILPKPHKPLMIRPRLHMGQAESPPLEIWETQAVNGKKINVYLFF